MQVADDLSLLREEIRYLKGIISEKDEHIRQMKDILLPPEWEPPLELGLTPKEARVLACLYKARGGVVSKESVYFTLYHDVNEQPEAKTIDVFVCKARAKLKKFGITINTVWARGYSLDPKSIPIIRDWGIDPQEESLTELAAE